MLQTTCCRRLKPFCGTSTCFHFWHFLLLFSTSGRHTKLAYSDQQRARKPRPYIPIICNNNLGTQGRKQKLRPYIKNLPATRANNYSPLHPQYLFNSSPPFTARGPGGFKSFLHRPYHHNHLSPFHFRHLVNTTNIR